MCHSTISEEEQHDDVIKREAVKPNKETVMEILIYVGRYAYFFSLPVLILLDVLFILCKNFTVNLVIMWQETKLKLSFILFI